MYLKILIPLFAHFYNLNINNIHFIKKKSKLYYSNIYTTKIFFFFSFVFSKTYFFIRDTELIN